MRCSGGEAKGATTTRENREGEDKGREEKRKEGRERDRRTRERTGDKEREGSEGGKVRGDGGGERKYSEREE